MLVMKSGKRHITEGKLPNQEILEHSEKMLPTISRKYWKLTPPNKLR